MIQFVVGFMVTAAVTSAWAGNFRPWYADNAYHTFYYGNTTYFANSNSNWVRTNRLDPTDLRTEMQSHDSSDVHLNDDYYDTTWDGLYECITSVSTSECGHAHVKLNLKHVSTDTDAKQTLCHEYGHTVGLGHDTSRSTCMKSDDSITHYSDHDKAHINGRY